MAQRLKVTPKRRKYDSDLELAATISKASIPVFGKNTFYVIYQKIGQEASFLDELWTYGVYGLSRPPPDSVMKYRGLLASSPT